MPPRRDFAAKIVEQTVRLEAPAGPRRAPHNNPAPAAWKGKAPSTPYPCGKTEAKKLGANVPGPRGGSLVGCATPNKTHPREGQYQTQRGDGPKHVLRKSVVARRLRNAGKRVEPGMSLLDIAASAQAQLAQPEPHIPTPTGVDFPHRTGTARCAPDHPMWEQVEGAVEDARERLAIETPEDVAVTDGMVAARLAEDPRYGRWVATEQACATGVVRKLEDRTAREAIDSPRRALARRTAEFIARGGDTTSADYFDDVLEPEQREGFFYRQWVKSGRRSTGWKRLYDAAKAKRVSAEASTRTRSVFARRPAGQKAAAPRAVPPKRAPAPAMAAKRIQSNPSPHGTVRTTMPASAIRPPHGVTRPEHLRALVDSMRKRGWFGRPLLVERNAHGVQSWTGSHRLAAAAVLGIDVPVIVIPTTAFEAAGLHRGRAPFYFHAVRASNHARHSAAIACGCPHAAALMAQEIEGDRARAA